MKLAKKVLSVVLAMVLALSAFAVVGSANGNPDADYQVKIWLTGTVGEVNWTSATKLSMSETGEESAPGATIEVQPGDEVFVRFYITNNYYVHTFQSPVFFSTELLEAAQIYEAQTGKACSKARLAKMHLWNTAEHSWTHDQGVANSAYNASTMQTPTFNANVAQNWPTDDEGNVLLDMNEWRFNFFNNLTQETSGVTYIWDEEVWLFSMPLSIPEDAQPGDTFYVTIPEGLEQRDAKPNGALRLSEIGIAEGESEPCDIVDAQALLTPNMKWGNENQYYDLSEATLTLQVPGAAAVDTAELEAKLAEAASLLTTDITAASIAALNEAIEAGNAALTSNDQDTVNAAVETLAAAIAAAEGLANYTELNNAIARYEALDADAYDAASFANATDKYNAAKAIEAGLGVSAQDTIDAAAAALNTAIDNLAAALDYSALEAKYNELANKNVANYTDDTVAEFNAALAAANALVDNKNAADQNEIDAAYDRLVAADAALALKAADYTALKAAIAKYEALDAKAWTTASYAAATEKYEAAKAIAEGLDITAQPTITAAAEALEAAITALVPATGADYNELNAAKAEFEALVADNYTEDTYAAAKTAYDAACEVPADLTSEQQAQIDDAATALRAALDALVEADADYTAVNAAITAAKAKIAENDQGILRYTDESIAKVNEAIEAVVAGLKKKDQPVVNGYADAINAAVAALEYRPYDYSKILAHTEAIEANPEDYYKAADYAEYLEAKAGINWNYTHEQFGLAKLQEINFLKVNPASAGAADYTAVNDAITAFEDKIAAADYEQAGIDAVNAIIDGINWDLNENHQAEVDAYAAAIIEATAALVEVVVEYADYTAYNEALAAAKAVDATLYTAASYEAFIAAVDEIDAGLAKDLLAADQAKVDDATAAIGDAYSILEGLADYSALEAAILRAGTYDQNVWTTDSWAVVEEKLAAAKAVAPGLGVSAQGTIDAAAEALNTALDNLKAKEVVSSISTINWTPSEDTHNTFTVAVTGRMAMIQFIEEDGGTRTYDRYNKNVTIVSYNAAGEEVNSLSRDVAYEVWTINTNLIGPNVKARAKYLEGTSYKWETETYNFEVKVLEPTFDADIRSITPAATSGKKGAVATTVVVGPDAQGIRFVMDNGTTATYYAEKATVLDNGDLQFVGNAWANNEGLNTIVVKVRVNGAWVEAGTVEYTVE